MASISMTCWKTHPMRCGPPHWSPSFLTIRSKIVETHVQKGAIQMQADIRCATSCTGRLLWLWNVSGFSFSSEVRGEGGGVTALLFFSYSLSPLLSVSTSRLFSLLLHSPLFSACLVSRLPSQDELPARERLLAAKYDMDANPRRAYARYTPERDLAKRLGRILLSFYVNKALQPNPK